MLKKIFKNKTNFLNTGSPRIDLLDRRFYDENKNRFLKKFGLKKYILIPTNISFPIGLKRIADSYYGFMSDTNKINLLLKQSKTKTDLENAIKNKNTKFPKV